MCPKALKIFQMRFNSLPNIKSTRKQLPKTFKMLPLWRNFTISGHTDRNSLFVIPLFHLFLSFSLFHVQLRSSLVNKTTQKIVDKLFSFPSKLWDAPVILSLSLSLSLSPFTKKIGGFVRQSFSFCSKKQSSWLLNWEVIGQASDSSLYKKLHAPTLSLLLLNTSVTSKKLPNACKSCPKMTSLEKLKILTPLQEFPKNVGDLGKLIVATSLENFPKVQ